MRPRRGIDRQRTAHTELVDLAEPLAARVADLPALVAILAAESDARGDAFAERAGNMAADIVRLIIAEVGLDAAFEAVGRLGGDAVAQAGRGVAAIERALRPLDQFAAVAVTHRRVVCDGLGVRDQVPIIPTGPTRPN